MDKTKLILLRFAEIVVWLIMASAWAVVVLKAVHGVKLINIPVIEKTPEGWILVLIASALTLLRILLTKYRGRVKEWVDEANLHEDIREWAVSLQSWIGKVTAYWNSVRSDVMIEAFESHLKQVSSFLAQDASIPLGVVDRLKEIQNHLMVAKDLYNNRDGTGAKEYLGKAREASMRIRL